MKPTRFFAATALALATSLPAAGQVVSDCRQLTSGVPEPGAWTITGKQVATLWDVYERISKAADHAPDLWLCESLMPDARVYVETEVIRVTTGLVRLFNGDADELAAVIGHEFGHLLHRHGDRQRVAAQIAGNQLRRSMARVSSNKEAVAATINAISTFTAFSREFEKEADDEGFSLALRAGFSHSGARRAFEKFAQRFGTAQRGGYLATHPGLGSRVTASARLELNESFRERAARAFDRRDRNELQAIVHDWRVQVPDSGAGAYYEAMVRLMTPGSPEALAKLDEAVGYFHGEGMSRIAQAYQAESSDAVLALCVSLYRKGERARALNCLQLLKTEEDLRQFRQITGWNAFVFVPSAREDSSNLYVSRVTPGAVALTNSKRLADEANLASARAWRVPSQPRGNAAAPAGHMVCSRDLCNCEMASEEEKQAISRASRLAP